jgi:AICAR transformylase/IMP cyclohydrolase PurH
MQFPAEALIDSTVVKTERQPAEEEWRAQLFGWKVCKHVKSNAIVRAAGPNGVGWRRTDEPGRFREGGRDEIRSPAHRLGLATVFTGVRH